MSRPSPMYADRQANIPVFRGCSYNCVYCSFKRLVQMNKKCPSCAEFKPHSHIEVLQRKPPRTKEGEFLTVGLAGDVNFMKTEDFAQVIQYCRKWKDRTFLIQSKDPEYFLPYRSGISQVAIPDNVILGTTIETNQVWLSCPTEDPIYKELIGYPDISLAPLPQYRYAAMVVLNCRKAVTIEPILSFDLEVLVKWIKDIAPEFCYVGYCNDGKQGKRLKLPEPPLAKTLELIAKLREAGIEVRTKTLRPAWWEDK